jgi:glycosyltransferase involved in cell wall biosynthesis
LYLRNYAFESFMNVLFLTRRFYPEIGGVETHVLALGKELVRIGHKVTVVTQMPKSQNNSLEISRSIDGIHVYRIDSGIENRFWKFKVWKALWNYRFLINSADVVHCHDVFFWYLPFRLIFPNKKVYITFHGYEGVFPPLQKAVFVRKISEVLSHGSICVGDYIKKWYGTNPDYVTYGGVSEVKDTAKGVKDAHLLNIVLLGRFDKDIGVDMYLNSLKLLKNKKTKFRFKAYGEGPLSKKIKKYGHAYSFVRNVDTALAGADIVFASSYLSILEALIRKKIIISVFENALKEDYLKMSPFASLIYICRSPREVFEVLESVKEHPWKSASMVENGYQWARKQSWSEVVKMYLKLWKI